MRAGRDDDCGNGVAAAVAGRPGSGGRKLKAVQRTEHPMAAAIQHMGINHGGGDIGVTQELLDGADVVAAFQQMGGKAVTQGMTVDPLTDRGRHGRLFDALLQAVFMDMVPPGLAAARIERQPAAGKNILPGPFLRGIGIFPGQGVGKKDLTRPLGQIILVQPVPLAKMVGQYNWRRL